jgi:parallel beta-helix repeat protein
MYVALPVTAFSDGGSPPDLVVSKIDLLSPLAPGGQVSVQVTCKNTGQAASGSFPIEGWIFSRPDYKFSMMMGTITAAGLGAGESATYRFSFTLPGNAPSGKYDIKVAADNSNYAGSGSITEADENNNEKWLVDVSGPSTPQGTPTPTPIPASTPVPCREYDFTTGNIGAVSNNPSKPLVLTFDTSIRIKSISDYHWNDGKGKSPGTIALQSSSGQVYGPWQARGSAGQGGVPDAYWTVEPGITLPAGTYTVVDSDPATWSHNSESGNRGMTAITYEPASCSGSQPVSTPTSAPVVTPTVYVPPPGSAADLWVSEIIGPMTANAGSTISISASVGNNGNVATPAADLLYALVFTTDVKKAYVLGDSVTTQGFSAHASGTATRQVTIPDNVPPGNYYIGVWIDPDGKIPDSNPDNNLASNEPNFIMVRAPVVVVTKAPVITQVRTPLPVYTQTPVVTQTRTPATVIPTRVPVVTQTATVTPGAGITAGSTPTPTRMPGECIPITKPVVITEPGNYCLENDISGLALYHLNSGIVILTSGVTIDGRGHSVDLLGQKNALGIYADGNGQERLSSIAIKNIKVKNGGKTDQTGYSAGICLVDVDGPIIENVEVSGIVGYGIFPQQCPETVIRNSKVYGITGSGIWLANTCPRSQVRDTTINSCSEVGISISWEAKDSVLVGNEIKNNGHAGIGLGTSGTEVLDNTLENNGYLDTGDRKGGGIALSGFIFNDRKLYPENNIIKNNVIRYGGDYGVAMGNSLRNTVTGNTITDNPTGIHISSGSQENSIYNNLLRNGKNLASYLDEKDRNQWSVSPQGGPNIMGGPSVGGNYWGQPDGNGFSQVTQDADHDGFCDLPNVLNTQNIDAFPLVDYANPPAITAGSISISSVPSGASILFDGADKGVTPATIKGIPAGSHTITLKKTGYLDYSGKVDVVAGQTVQVNPTLSLTPTSTPTPTTTPTKKPTTTAKPTVTTKAPVIIKTSTIVPPTVVSTRTPTRQPTAVSQPTAVLIPTKTVKPTVTTLKPTSIVVLTKTPLPPTQVPQNPCSPPAGSTFEERMAAAVFTETNKARAANGLPSLCWDPKIATVSKGFASAMAAAQNMPGDHNLPGNLWNDRSKAINGFGFAITSIRENIATGVSGNVYTDCNGPLHKVADTPEGIAEFVVDMWMNHDTCHNDGHRKNILASVTHIGVGVVKGSNGRYYIAQDFGAK